MLGRIGSIGMGNVGDTEGAGVGRCPMVRGYDALKRATVARQWRQGLGTLEI